MTCCPKSSVTASGTPCSCSHCTTARWPSDAATCMGCRPLFSPTVSGTSCSCSHSNTDTWPWAAAFNMQAVSFQGYSGACARNHCSVARSPRFALALNHASLGLQSLTPSAHLIRGTEATMQVVQRGPPCFCLALARSMHAANIRVHVSATGSKSSFGTRATMARIRSSSIRVSICRVRIERQGSVLDVSRSSLQHEEWAHRCRLLSARCFGGT